LLRSEAREDLVFGIALCLRGAIEALLAASGEGYDVTTPVGGVALARDEAVSVERVEQCDEDAWVYVHAPTEVALRERAVVVEESE
jgi:hypothetical protein